MGVDLPGEVYTLTNLFDGFAPSATVNRVMSTTIIYHKADADGKFSNAVTRIFNPEATSIGWDYGDPTPAVGDRVLMVDCSVPALMDHPGLTWIDHHRTAIDKYGSRPGIQREGVAACRLCWEYFTGHRAEEMIRGDLEPLALFLAGLRDVWKHVGTDWEEEADLFNLSLAGVPVEDYHGLLCLIDTQVDVFIAEGKAIRRYADAMAKEFADRGARTIHWEGLKFRVLNTQGRGSKTLDGYADGCDALMVWAQSATGVCNVSLYHNTDKTLDLSKIAAKYGGGGHPGACGFQISLPQLCNILL